MSELKAQRTLVKSPPELWAELSDPVALARHLGEFGEIRITRVVPEQTVAWEGERASGTVELSASGWGTKVTLKARLTDSPEASVIDSPEASVPEQDPAGETETEPRAADAFEVLNSIERDPLPRSSGQEGSQTESVEAAAPGIESFYSAETVNGDTATEGMSAAAPTDAAGGSELGVGTAAPNHVDTSTPESDERVDVADVPKADVTERSDGGVAAELGDGKEPKPAIAEAAEGEPVDSAVWDEPTEAYVPVGDHPDAWFAESAHDVEPLEPPPAERVPPVAAPERRLGFFARLFGRRRAWVLPPEEFSAPIGSPETAAARLEAGSAERLPDSEPVDENLADAHHEPGPAGAAVGGEPQAEVPHVDLENPAGEIGDAEVAVTDAKVTDPEIAETETGTPGPEIAETETAAPGPEVAETETPDPEIAETDTPDGAVAGSETAPAEAKDADPEVPSDPQPVNVSVEKAPQSAAADDSSDDRSGPRPILDAARAEAVLTAVLDELGTARHRPYSRA